jgi:RNA polymerase sigma-70 factor (ECF subfamily)
MPPRSEKTSEEDLVRRLQGGDEAAFEGVVLRYHPRLQELAFRLTGDLEEARDIGQLALLRAFETLTRFRGEARLSTWLYRVVLNLCRDRHRKATAYADHVAQVDAPSDAVAGEELPGARMEGRETAEVVADAVRSLPDREREVVLLRHYHDLTFADIAEIQGEPVTTVKSRMNKGLRLLRGRLKSL